MKMKITLTALLIFICTFVYSQYSNWENYTNCDGVCSIIPFGEDILFGGTGTGLIRYSGSSRTIYDKANSGISSNLINCMATDHNGGVWIGTYPYMNSNLSIGLSYFDGSTWQRYTTDNFGIPSNNITALAVDVQNRLWVGTRENGIGVYNGETWEYFVSSDSLNLYGINDIEIAADGNVWVGKYSGVANFNGSDWEMFTVENSDLPDNKVIDIESDTQGNVWIGTLDGGLTRIDINDNWTTFNKENSGLPKDAVQGIFCADNGIWLAMNGEGVVHFNDSEWTVYNSSNSGLTSNYNSGIYVDQNGTVWVGSTYRGIFSFDGNIWQNRLEFFGEIPNKDVFDIEVDNNSKVWIGTNGGLAVKEGSSWHYFNSSNSILGNNITSLALDPDDHCWILCYDGIYYHNGSTFIDYSSTNPVFNDEYLEVVEVNGSKVWVGMYGKGAAVYDGSLWTNYQTNNSEICSNFVWAIAFDEENSTWFGTSAGLSVLYSEGAWQTWNSINSEIPPAKIYGIAIDSTGNKWLASQAGLIMFDGIDFTVYTTENSGLPSNAIKSVNIDQAGTIWAGTNYGLVSFDGTSWEVYDNTNSGLSGSAIPDIEIDKFGNKWISTLMHGVAVYNENGILNAISETATHKQSLNLTLFPNPSTDVATIKYHLPEKSDVQVRIFNQLGSFIASFDEANQPRGDHQLKINTSKYSTGIYTCQIVSDQIRESILMVIIK